MEHFSYYCISHTTKWQKYLSLDFDNMEYGKRVLLLCKIW